MFGIDGPPRTRFECFEEYLFYGDSVSADDVAAIDAYVEPFPIVDYHGMYWDRQTKWYKPGVVSATHSNASGTPSSRWRARTSWTSAVSKCVAPRVGRA